MKRKLVITATLISISFLSFAQKGNNQIGLGAEVAFPTGDFGKGFNAGFGGWIKLLYGAGKSGQVSFSTGYTSFKAKGSGSEGSASISILPFLLGYKYFPVGKFYIEPQLGYASYNAKVSFGGMSASGGQGAFTYAAGIGYDINDIDIGLRYQSGEIDGTNFGSFALRFGYNFKLKSK